MNTPRFIETTYADGSVSVHRARLPKWRAGNTLSAEIARVCAGFNDVCVPLNRAHLAAGILTADKTAIHATEFLPCTE